MSRLVILSLLAFAGSASAYDFKGIEVGGPKTYEDTEIASKFGFTCYNDKELEGVVNCAGNTTVGGAPVFGLIRLAPNKLVEYVTVKFESEDYDEVEKAVLTKFGKPEFKKSVPMQNRLGASFENVMMLWKGPKAQVVMRKYADTTDVGQLVIASNAAMNKSVETSKAKANDL